MINLTLCVGFLLALGTENIGANLTGIALLIIIVLTTNDLKEILE
jgi:hypothetical protein